MTSWKYWRMYTGIVFLSSESPAWKFRSSGVGLGNRISACLGLQVSERRKKEWRGPFALWKWGHDVASERHCPITHPVTQCHVLEERYFSYISEGEGGTLPQPSRSIQAGSLFNQWAACEFSEITAHHEACLFVCLFVWLVGWLVVGWMVG